MTAPASAAVVGTGSVGRRHLANLAALGVEDVIAVSEHRRASHVDVSGRRFEAVPDLDAALGQGAELVVVANPSSMHLDTAARAVEAGRHLLVEKPVSVNASGVKDLQRRASRQGVVAGVVQQFRFHPLAERLRGTIRDRELGLLLMIEAVQGEHLADYHPEEDYRRSYAARGELGGGVLLTQIHLLDLIVWVFGPPISVMAVGGHRSDLEVDVEDVVSFLCRYDDGLSAYGHVDYLQRPPRFTVSVTGTGGRMECDYHEGWLQTTTSAGTTREPSEARRNDLFLAVLRDFFHAMRTGDPPRCSLADAADCLRVVDAIKQSMARRREIEVR